MVGRGIHENFNRTGIRGWHKSWETTYLQEENLTSEVTAIKVSLYLPLMSIPLTRKKAWALLLRTENYKENKSVLLPYRLVDYVLTSSFCQELIIVSNQDRPQNHGAAAE